MGRNRVLEAVAPAAGLDWLFAAIPSAGSAGSAVRRPLEPVEGTGPVRPSRPMHRRLRGVVLAAGVVLRPPTGHKRFVVADFFLVR